MTVAEAASLWASLKATVAVAIRQGKYPSNSAKASPSWYGLCVCVSVRAHAHTFKFKCTSISKIFKINHLTDDREAHIFLTTTHIPCQFVPVPNKLSWCTENALVR